MPPHRFAVTSLAPGLALGLALLALARPAAAQDSGEPPTAAPPPPPRSPAWTWQGAVGVTGSYHSAPATGGSAGFKALPSFYLRYGRLSATNTGALATRSSDDVVRGLGLEVLRSERVQASASLRVDPGRRQSKRGDLEGLGQIKPTVRTRLAASWQPGGAWRLGASWNVDAFGRGGGDFGDISAGWEHRLAPATVLNLGSSLTVANRHYMQTYDGVTAEQAARTRFPVYEPHGGLRDSALFANLRHDISADWVALAGVYARRLQGPAAASPLSRNRNRAGISSTLAWRF